MRVALLVLASGCSYSPQRAASDDDAKPIDAALSTDAGADAAGLPRALCEPAPGLLVCFSFDQDPLPSSLANEGTAAVSAAVSGVTRINKDAGGAALLDTTSLIRVPPNGETTGFLSVEAWVRVDADPPVGQRVGIIDADATSSAVSFFYYYPSPNRQIRFEIGQQLFLDHTLDLGTWHYLAQVCDNGMLTAFVDGAPIGSQAGCSPGNATTFGLQLGQNNTGTGGDQPLVGAIDGIRMWTVPLSPTAICETAGRSDC